jgi:outer membrane biosynthesis protein TonB
MANFNNGTVTINVSGGTAPFVYTLLDENGAAVLDSAYTNFTNNQTSSDTSFTFGDVTDITGEGGLAPGLYSIKAVDANGCTIESNQVTVEGFVVPTPTPTSSASATPTPTPTSSASETPTPTPTSSESQGYVSLTASVPNLAEGTLVTFALNSVNIPDNTTVGYSLSGTGITSDDLVNAAQMTGSFLMDGNLGDVSIAIKDDNTLEGDETLTMTLVTLDSNGVATNELSVDVIINDQGVLPTPSPTVSTTNTPTPTPSESEPVPTATATATPTPSPSESEPVPTATATATATPTPTASTTNTPTPSPTVSTTNTPTPTPTSSTTNTPTPTPTSSTSATPTPTPSTSEAGVPDSYLLRTGSTYPYASTGNLVNDWPQFTSDNASQSEFGPILTDWLANPGDYGQLGTVSTWNAGATQFTFNADGISSWYFIAIPDSAGVPDLTANPKLHIVGDLVPSTASEKVTFTYNSENWTLYRMNTGAQDSAITVDYV